MALTHALVGAGSCTVAFQVAGMPATATVLTVAVLGSLAPDVDHPGSWLGRRVFPLSLLFSWLVGHRGVTHSVLAFMVLSLSLHFLVPNKWAALVPAFQIGYLSHLFSDWNTSSGIPVLWPSERRFCAPWAFPTGGAAEMVICLTLIIFFGMAGYATLNTKASQIGASIHQTARAYLQR